MARKLILLAYDTLCIKFDNKHTIKNIKSLDLEN